MISTVSTIGGFLDRRLRWLSLAASGALSSSNEIALESDRWFLEALRSVEKGATRAQHGIDSVTAKVIEQLSRRRPRWLRRRSSRERIERSLRAEAKRHGVDVTQEEFRAFSEKIAVLLELVYTGTVPLDAIAFEAAETAGQEVDELRSANRSSESA